MKLAFLTLTLALPAAAQQYTITTVAGGANPATPTPANSASIGQPRRVALDSSGNVYFSSGNSVFKLSGSTLTVVAGNSRAGFSGDGGRAVNAQLDSPQGIAVDSAGNVYIADTNNNRVRIVAANGIINTFAGNGLIGTPLAFGDGGPANQANLQLPGGVAIDSNGNVYIADTGDNLIRKVTTDGIINTIAGDSLPGYSGNGGPPANAEVHSPEDIAVDSSGNIYITDTANDYVRKITPGNNQINYIAGNGSAGYSSDGTQAGDASLLEPFSLAVDAKGNVYFTLPEDQRIRELTVADGKLTTVAGNGVLGFAGDGGSASKAEFHQPLGVAVDASGNVYIADTLNSRIRKVSGGTITTIAGNGIISYSGDSGPATSAQLFAPQGVAVDSAGDLFIADTRNNVVREVSSKGVISTIAGTGTAGYGGDNGPAGAAQLNAPQGVAIDSSGNVYVSDTNNQRVRKISNGTITTIAGNGTIGYSGDNGAAGSAMLNSPVGLALDKSGNLYIADQGNNVVRRVSGGTITTYAGNGLQGYSGDGGPARNAQLNAPQGLAVDGAGNLYIADSLNSVVREVASGGTIQTIAGTGVPGYSGDGGLAVAARFGSPAGVAVDPAGNVYVSDSSRIREVFSGGIVNTIAGTGAIGYSGDNGDATFAMLNGASGIAVDSSGNLYVVDSANNAIRELTYSGTGLSIAAVTNGASNQTGAIAPGEVIVIYGSNIGASSLTVNQPAGGQFSTSVAGASVYVNGQPAPMLYSSRTQVSAIVPFGLTGSATQVFVVNQGQPTSPVTVNVVPTAPAVFTANASGTGQAAAINADQTPNSASNPAKAGSVISLFITGGGQTNPPSQDGVLAAVPLPQLSNVSAAIGGKQATVNYSGGSPGTVNGVIQVNVTIPSGLPAGNASVIVQVGNAASQGNVTIAVAGS